MFDPDTDARRMLVRERHQTLALDALRHEPRHATEARGTSGRRRRRVHLRWPALHLPARLALLGSAPKTISAAHVEPQQSPSGGGSQ